VTPETAGWEYVGFEVIRLEEGGSAQRETGGEEVCLVVLSGRCSVGAGQNEWDESAGAGTPSTACRTPSICRPAWAYRVEATTDLEIAVCSAPAQRGVEARLMRPEDVEVSTRGSGNAEREVRNIVMEGQPAEKLLVVEVITPNGHWSSYPPHKHDQDDRPNETYLRRPTTTGPTPLRALRCRGSTRKTARSTRR
jgi:5-deoxy-glucuronate isomerase